MFSPCDVRWSEKGQAQAPYRPAEFFGGLFGSVRASPQPDSKTPRFFASTKLPRHMIPPASVATWRYLLVACLAFPSVSHAAQVAWFYALEQDRAAFEKLAGPPMRSITTGAVTLHHYQVGTHQVCAARMGSGATTTAAATATCLALFPADRVISTGPAGALDGRLAIGSWHFVNRVVAWQKGKAAAGRILAGANSATDCPTPLDDWPAGEWRSFPPTPAASGEAFVASVTMRDQLAEDTQCRLVEMNAAGLLSALEGRSAKWLILRVISDHADESADEDFVRFLKGYDGRGGAIVYAIAKQLPPDPGQPAAHDSLRRLLDGLDTGPED